MYELNDGERSEQCVYKASMMRFMENAIERRCPTEHTVDRSCLATHGVELILFEHALFRPDMLATSSKPGRSVGVKCR